MISPTHKATKQGKPAPWVAGAASRVTPTLFILHGLNTKSVNELQGAVSQRMEQYIELGAVRWFKWPNKGISADKVAEICRPVLQLDFWQRLVESGYWPQLPDASHPLQLQFVVVCDATNGIQQDVIDQLDKLAEAIEGALTGSAEYSLRLILLGNEAIEPSRVSAYWPRIRLGSMALGGTQVDQDRILQVCQHILVALTTSELVRAMDYVVGEKKDSVGWITVGASVLLTDLSTMRQWMQTQVLKGLLAPLVRSDSTDLQRGQLDELVAARVTEFRAEMLGEASRIAEEVGWKIERNGQQIERCQFQSAALKQAVFGPYWLADQIARRPRARRRLIDRLRSLSLKGLIARIITFGKQTADLIAYLRQGFVPDQGQVAAALTEHYCELYDLLLQGLAKRASQEDADWQKIFAFLLDHGFNPPASMLLSSRNVSLPAGLRAAMQAVTGVIAHLSPEDDIVDMRAERAEIVQPAPLRSREYWGAAARTDSDVAYTGALRHRRFVRTIISPLGVIVKLIPAFPLLTGLLDLLPSWSMERAAVVAGVSLLLIGTVELIFWWLFRTRQLLDMVHKRTHRCLSDRVLTLISEVLRDRRLFVVARLSKASATLDELYTVLLSKYQELESLEQRYVGSTRSKEDGTIYQLGDFDLLSKWAQKAVQSANNPASLEETGETEKFEGVVTALIAKRVWPLPERAASSQSVVQALEEQSTHWVQQDFAPVHVGVFTLADGIFPEGKKWSWLWQHAQPLSDKSSAQSTAITVFTVAVKDAESHLSGTTGKSSAYWRPDWLITHSRQTHELGCVRGVIEWI